MSNANKVPDTAGNTPEPWIPQAAEVWVAFDKAVNDSPEHIGFGSFVKGYTAAYKNYAARVAAPSQEAAPAPVQGSWPLGVHRAFVAGADWWQWHANKATMFASERDEAEAEAVRKFGPVGAEPSASQEAATAFTSPYCPECGSEFACNCAEPAPSPALNEEAPDDALRIEWQLASFLAGQVWDEWHGPLAKIPATHSETTNSLFAMLRRFLTEKPAMFGGGTAAPSPATKDTPRTKFFIDTEFIESGPGCSIDLLSIGIVCEDGREFYAESASANMAMASDWVMENVVPHLTGDKELLGPMGERITKFVGDCKPEFWGYYADYDWVVFCQIFGIMMDLPKGWPMYCRDLKQLCDSLGNPKLPAQSSTEHNALNDARWNLQAYKFLQAYDAGAQSRTAPDTPGEANLLGEKVTR